MKGVVVGEVFDVADAAWLAGACAVALVDAEQTSDSDFFVAESFVVVVDSAFEPAVVAGEPFPVFVPALSGAADAALLADDAGAVAPLVAVAFAVQLAADDAVPLHVVQPAVESNYSGQILQVVRYQTDQKTRESRKAIW